MTAYVLRRALITAGLIYLVATLIFLFIRVIPGDPAELLLTSVDTGTAPSPAQVQAVRAELGLDRPLLVQYETYVEGLVHLDLGRSFVSGDAVAADIAVRLPRTLELIVVGTALALVAGVTLGSLAALHRNSGLDGVVTVIASSGISIPVFVVGTVLVLALAEDLRLLPAGGFVPFSANPRRHALDLVMPAGSIAFALTASIARMTRSSVLETLEREWVRTAHGKGLPPSRVFVRHVLRNSLAPVLTIVGLDVGGLLGRSVLVEYVFNWAGLGLLLLQSVQQRDYPEVQGIVLVVSIGATLVNFAVDLLYALLDPRVRYA